MATDELDLTELNMQDPATLEYAMSQSNMADPETKKYFDQFKTTPAAPAAPNTITGLIEGQPPQQVDDRVFIDEDSKNVVKQFADAGKDAYEYDDKGGVPGSSLFGKIGESVNSFAGSILGWDQKTLDAENAKFKDARKRAGMSLEAAASYGPLGYVARKWYDWSDTHKDELKAMHPGKSEEWYEDTMDKIINQGSRQLLEGVAKEQAKDPTWAPDQSFLDVVADPEKWVPYMSGAFVGSADPSMFVAPGESFVTRILSQMGIGAAVDAGTQGLNIKDDVQDDYSVGQTLASGGMQGGMRGLFEIPAMRRFFSGETDLEGNPKVKPTNPDEPNPFGRDDQRPAFSSEQADAVEAIAKNPKSTAADVFKWNKDNGYVNNPEYMKGVRDWYKARNEGRPVLARPHTYGGEEAAPVQQPKPVQQGELFGKEDLGKAPVKEPGIVVTAPVRKATPVGQGQLELYPRAERLATKPVELPPQVLERGGVRPPNTEAAKARVNTAVDHINEMTKNWKNPPAYEVVDALDDITDPKLRAAIDKDPKAFEDMVGVTLPDGRVVINMKNVDNPATLKAVTYHEGLGHHGLASKHADALDGVLEDVYHNSKGTFKADVDKWLADNPQSYKGDPNRTIRGAEEVLAEMSEAGRITPTLYGRISKIINDFSRQMGRPVKYSPREIRTILAMAHDATVKGKPGDVVGNGFKFMMTGERGRQGERNLDNLENTRQAYDAAVNVRGETEANKIFGNEGTSRKRTGWFRGNDGEWRFEIDDSRSNFDAHQFALDSRRMQVLGQRKQPPKTLGEYFRHPELYKLYPDLEKTRVLPTDEAGINGSYSPITGDIRLSPHSPDVKGTLLHEIQHKIQHKEGFASGGSTETVISKMTDDQVMKEYKTIEEKHLQTYEKDQETISNLREIMKPERMVLVDKARAARNKYDATVAKMDKLRQDMPDVMERIKSSEWKKLDAEYRQDSTEMKETLRLAQEGLSQSAKSDLSYAVNDRNRTPKDNLNERLELAHRLSLSSAQRMENIRRAATIDMKKKALSQYGSTFDYYKRLEGEYEARDTAARKDLDELGRLDEAPMKSEDILPEDRFVTGWDNTSTMETGKFMRKKPREDGEARRDNIGSINPEKIRTVSTPEEIDDALTELAIYNPKTRVSVEETVAAAEARGLSPARIAKRKGLGNPGDLASYLHAANTALAESLDVFRKANKRLDEEGFSMQGYEQAMTAMSRLKAVHARVSGDNSEVGRALNILKQMKHSKDFAKTLTEMTDNVDGKIFTDPDTFMKFMRQVSAADDDAATKMIKDSFKPWAEDVLFRAWYNMKLSSPKTHTANFLGTGINFLVDIANDVGAATLGQAKRFNSNAERMAYREVGMRAYGTVKAMLQGSTYQRVRAAGNTGRTSTDVETRAAKALEKEWVKSGKDLEDIRQSDIREYMERNNIDPTLGSQSSAVFGAGHVYTGKNPVAGAVSGVLESPVRIMAGTDEWWRSVIQLGNYHSQAYRQAAKEGLKGQNFRDRVNDLTENPTRQMIDTTNDYAKSLQFLDQPSSFAKRIIDAQTPKGGDAAGKRVAKAVFRFAIPFVRTPDRLLARALHVAPTTVMSAKFRAEMKAGGVAKDRAVARLVMGSALTGYIAAKAASLDITGNGPADFQKNKEWRKTYQPNSIKIGDSWKSYQGLEPLSTILSTVATSIERSRSGEISDESIDQTAMAIPLTIAEATLNNQYLEDFQQLVSITEEKPARGLRELNDLKNSIITGFTTPAIMDTYAKTRDPSVRAMNGDGTEPDRLYGKIQASSTNSTELPQVYDSFGRPQVRSFFGPEMMSRVQQRPVETDPTVLEVQRLTKGNSEVVIGEPGRSVKVGGVKRRLTDPEYEDYKRVSGSQMKSDLDVEIQDESWKDLDEEEKLKVVKDIRDKARKDAREELFSEEPDEEEDEDASEN